jgi:hypothetical protein
LAGEDCDPKRTYFTNKGNHNCGETTCFYRAGVCDCNNNGKFDPGTKEKEFTCVSNNKYYEGHVNGQPQFKKPPVVCNDICGNFNCTYTFYTKENCASEQPTKFSEAATIYPPNCHDAACQYENAPPAWNSTYQQQGYTITTDLIVRGWGTYFELDHNYKSVKFNGHGNCGFFLYEKEWFKGKVGKFRGLFNGDYAGKPWNAKSDYKESLCRNINLEWFKGTTGSLETNDTCWGNAGRKNQTQLPGQVPP